MCSLSDLMEVAQIPYNRVHTTSTTKAGIKMVPVLQSLELDSSIAEVHYTPNPVL